MQGITIKVLNIVRLANSMVTLVNMVISANSNDVFSQYLAQLPKIIDEFQI